MPMDAPGSGAGAKGAYRIDGSFDDISVPVEFGEAFAMAEAGPVGRERFAVAQGDVGLQGFEAAPLHFFAQAR